MGRYLLWYCFIVYTIFIMQDAISYSSETNPKCPVDEDGETHHMIPDDVDEGSQVVVTTNILVHAFTLTCFAEVLPRQVCTTRY